jgi:Family of unknown function (DUF5335)
MSDLHTVPPQEWRTFFDTMSSALVGKRAELEVASLDLGDQIVAEWIGLRGITYDSGDDLLDVALDGTTHLIRHPREILVEEGPNGIASVAVLAADGTKEIVRLKDPVMLPAGRAAQ